MREDEKLDVKLTFGRIVVVSCFIEVLIEVFVSSLYQSNKTCKLNFVFFTF